jgi:hypothetical protein
VPSASFRKPALPNSDFRRSSRPDVLVHAEEIVRVVLRLDLHEARMLRTERGADDVVVLLAEEVEQVVAFSRTIPLPGSAPSQDVARMPA